MSMVSKIIPKRDSWREVNLGEVVTLQRGHDLPKIKMQKGTIPVAGSNGIIGYHNESTTKAPGVTVGRSGSIGATYLYTENFWAHNTTLYVKDFKGNVPLWIFYLLDNIDFGSLNTGSAVPTLNRNHAHLLLIALPPLPEQKAIAEVLSSLDDKIDLLHRQNKTLEKLAQTLFRKWFIENAKDDWEKVNLGSFFPIITGKKYANYSTEDGQYHFFSCAQKASKAPNYSFEGKAILLAGNGDFNVKRYEGKFEAYIRTYVLIPHQDKYFGLLYTLIKYFLSTLTGGAQGSVIQFITKPMISNFAFSLPTQNHDYELENLNELYERADYNQRQINTLTNLRDTLLPKLMNGIARAKK